MARQIQIPDIPRKELQRALRRKLPSRVRKRLVAVRVIVDGATVRQAARVVAVTTGTIKLWLKKARQSGLQSLLRDGYFHPRTGVMTADQAKAARREIATALEGELKPEHRSRLTAIDMVLAGQAIEAAARFALVREQTVKVWLSRVKHDGIAPMLRKRKPSARKLDADPAALRDLAAKEKNPRVRKRMLALACMAEGMGFYDAEIKSGLTRDMIKKRIERFRRDGIAAFRDEPNVGRQRKLNPDGLGQLHAKVLAEPKVTVEELSDWLRAHLHMRFSISGIRRLMEHQFGMVRRKSSGWGPS